MASQKVHHAESPCFLLGLETLAGKRALLNLVRRTGPLDRKNELTHDSLPPLHQVDARRALYKEVKFHSDNTKLELALPLYLSFVRNPTRPPLSAISRYHLRKVTKAGHVPENISTGMEELALLFLDITDWSEVVDAISRFRQLVSLRFDWGYRLSPAPLPPVYKVPDNLPLLQSLKVNHTQVLSVLDLPHANLSTIIPGEYHTDGPLNLAPLNPLRKTLLELVRIVKSRPGWFPSVKAITLPRRRFHFRSLEEWRVPSVVDCARALRSLGLSLTDGDGLEWQKEWDAEWDKA